MVIMMIQHEMLGDPAASGARSAFPDDRNCLLGLEPVRTPWDRYSIDIGSMGMLVVLMISKYGASMFNSQWMVAAKHASSTAYSSHARSLGVTTFTLCSRSICDLFTKFSSFQRHFC